MVFFKSLHPFKTSLKSFALFVVYLLLYAPNSNAELILTAPPRESLEDGRAVYEPLAKYLSSFLGERVIYEHPQNWHKYEEKMKKDEYDIIFDGPHFAAWRIETAIAKPLVKLPGSLHFVLVVKDRDKALRHVEDLIGKKICTLPAPNLGALTLFAMFPHPARQPEYRLIKGGFKEISNAFIAGECEGAILRSSFYYKKTDPLFREATRVLKTSKPLTNQGITISRRVKPSLYNKLVFSLTHGDGKSALKPILARFNNVKNEFLPATDNDYRNHNLLRDTTIYGW